MRNSKNTKNLYVAIVSIVIIIGVAMVYVFGGRPAKIEATDEGIVISGSYGDTYLYDDIIDIHLLTTTFEITARTNGSSIGTVLRGHFNTLEYGAVILFIDTEVETYIRIQHGDEIIIFNLPTVEETNEFYEEVLTHLSLN